MEIEVGDYVRDKDGEIHKIIEINNPNDELWTYYKFENNMGNYKETIIKHSKNIIDLIEVGDILLLFDKSYGENYKAEVLLDSIDCKSIINYEQCDLLNLEYELITEEHIKLLNILTKEQFESMSYKVG